MNFGCKLSAEAPFASDRVGRAAAREQAHSCREGRADKAMFTGGGGGFGATNPGQGAMMLELTKPPAAADRPVSALDCGKPVSLVHCCPLELTTNARAPVGTAVPIPAVQERRGGAAGAARAARPAGARPSPG